MWKRCLIIGLLLVFASLALADSVFVGEFERKEVKVQGFRNGVVELVIGGRAVDPVSAERVTRLVLDDDAEFTRADLAFAQGKWPAAVDGFQTAMRSTGRAWLKDWILPRLLVAADRARRIDVAAGAYVELLGRDPSKATQLRPRVAAEASNRALATAEDALSRAAESTTLRPVARLAILGLLLDVRRAQGDFAGAAMVAKELERKLPERSADPAEIRTHADARLAMARLDIARKEYARAIDQIQSHRGLFVEGEQQGEALYWLAVARDANAGGDVKGDALKDIAIDYMRAVGAGRRLTGAPHVPESLVRVAEIQQQLGDTNSAAALYAEVAAEYKDSPVAAKAVAAMKRLKEKNGM